MSDNTEMEYKCKCAIDCQRTHRECELRAEDNLNLCKEIDRLNKQLTKANTLLEECEKYIEADLCVLQDEKDIQDAQELLTKLKSKGNE